MTLSRRKFLAVSAASALLSQASFNANAPQKVKTIKPPRLRKGDLVSLISPAFAPYELTYVDIKIESLQAMGLKVQLSQNFYERYGYLAGTDQQRADDVNAAFADRDVKAVISHSGGWGCARILPFLDYETMKQNPKVLLGFSDNTSLLNAVYAKTGLITMHGPAPRNRVSAEYTRRLLFDGEKMTLRNPVDYKENLAPTAHRITVIHPGKARGRLVGGNLSVLSAIAGTPYFPDLKSCILFLEDVEEQIYRVDRMLTQLKLAGALDHISGFVFGRCSRCGPGERYGSLTLDELFHDHIRPLGIPAFHGFMVGHIKNQFTLPIGVEMEMDAEQGTLKMKESAVI
ncbi:MAG: LD-carboxypeptidase [Acidobacteria bacterium]|nr:MAG: LD-carboxypeptidase [Acidobacteriota bacterium]